MILCMNIKTWTRYSAVTTIYKKFNCTFCYPWLLHDQPSRNLLILPDAQGPSLAVTAAWVHFLITSYKILPQRKKKSTYIVLQHRGDQAKHFTLPPWSRNKQSFPNEDKGSCFMRTLLAKPIPRALTKPLHLGWVSLFVLHVWNKQHKTQGRNSSLTGVPLPVV